MISVTDLDRSVQFAIHIGGYESLWQGALEASEISAWGLPESAGAEALFVDCPGEDCGLIRFVRFENSGRKSPTRPASRAWNTGCYFSLMVRMKDMGAIYDDAIAMLLACFSMRFSASIHFMRASPTYFDNPNIRHWEFRST